MARREHYCPTCPGIIQMNCPDDETGKPLCEVQEIPMTAEADEANAVT